MVANLFNGRTYLAKSVKRDGLLDITLSFVDFTGYWKGTDAQIGDVVFIRGQDGKGYRLVVTNIISKKASQIVCTVEVDGATQRFLPSQYCAIVRETPNRGFPMFPSGLPLAIRSIMESYYAVIDDSLTTEGGCQGEEITRNNITGYETICLKMADGTHKGISLNELREWMLTLTNSTDENYRLGIGFMGAMFNQQVQ